MKWLHLVPLIAQANARSLNSWQEILMHQYLKLVNRKPVFGVSDYLLACSATDNSERVLKLRIYEPRCEKTGLRGFRPGPTQTGLYSHRRWLVT